MLRHVMTGMIRFYQMCLSVYLPPACRFLPTCSEYMRLAIETHGAALGVWLGIRRIGRCHPWGGCGFDPVPGSPWMKSPRHSSGER